MNAQQIMSPSSQDLLVPYPDLRVFKDPCKLLFFQISVSGSDRKIAEGNPTVKIILRYYSERRSKLSDNPQFLYQFLIIPVYHYDSRHRHQFLEITVQHTLTLMPCTGAKRCVYQSDIIEYLVYLKIVKYCQFLILKMKLVHYIVLRINYQI